MQADKSHIWANPSVPVHIDLEIQQERLRLALGADPGMERDDMIVAALANERVLLESETLAEWAHRPREHLEWERQEARLVLARARGEGARALEPGGGGPGVGGMPFSRPDM